MNYFRKKIVYLKRCVSSFFISSQARQFSFAFRKQQAYQQSANSQQASRLRNILAIGVLSSYYHNQIVQCIEDEMLARAKKSIEAQVKQMKQEFGTQMASFPEVKYTTRGNWYVIEFSVDQRKCDLYQLLITVLATFQKSDKSIFIIKNVQAGKDGNSLSIQIDFEEKKENQKGKVYNKGTISIRGEMINDIPGFKFQLEKTEEISELDIEAIMSVYKTANQPQQYSFVKDRMKQTSSNMANNDKAGPGAKPKSAKDLQKDKNDAIQKLEELGVSVFLPEQKSQNLDWVIIAQPKCGVYQFKDLSIQRFEQVYSKYIQLN